MTWDERLNAWKASKEVGKGLKAGLANLRDFTQQIPFQALGHIKDYFHYQVSDYGL